MGFMPQEKIQLSRVAETAEAVANAKQLLELGADGMKLYVASGGRNGASMSEKPAFSRWWRKRTAAASRSSFIRRPPTG